MIIILGFVVRLYKIATPLADWHSWRQVDTASVTKNLISSNYDILHPKYHDISSIQTGYFNPKGYRFVEFPVFNILHAQLHELLPQIPFESSGRIISIMAALLTTLIIYLLGKDHIGRWGGILSAFFYAFIPFNIYFTRVVLPDPLATFLATASVWLFYKYTKSQNLITLFLSSLVFSSAMLTKPFAIFYAVPIIYLGLKKFKPKEIITSIPLVLAFHLALSPFLLWRIWLNQGIFFVGIPHMSWAFNSDKIRFKPSFFKWIFAERIGTLILGVWGIFPFIIGIVSQKRKQSLINFIFLGSLLYLTIIATANVRHDYYQTFIIPAISLILAQGTIYLWKTKLNLLTKPLLVFSIGMMFLIGVYEIKGNYNINHPEIVKAGKAADKLLPEEALVIAPYNGDTTFLYQTGRSGWPVINESIEDMIKKGANYYISVNYDNDTNTLMQKYKPMIKNTDYIILDLTKPI